MDYMTGQQRVLTVSQFNRITKTLLENEPLLADATVKGEISNFKRYPSGHMYFTLKDAESALACVMFAGYTYTLKCVPSDGMQVLVRGTATVYEKDGRYQFLVKHLESDGVGGLYAAYEKLKKKLENEGLFDGRHKKPLPGFPGCVGVITSASGAAFRDILNVTCRRFPTAKILLYPSAVQGEEAPGQLLEGVRYFSAMKNVDILIIGRGGGSIEDLWAFNDEKLARAIYDCPIPTISAVGHETDYTICDFVCDRRAPTPSAAAEIAVPDRATLLSGLFESERKMKKGLQKGIEVKKEMLLRLGGSRVLSDKKAAIGIKKEKFENLSQAFLKEGRRYTVKKREFLTALSGKMVTLNPMAVLGRGYSAAFDAEGRVVRSVRNLKENEMLTLRMTDGSAKAEIREIEEYAKEGKSHACKEKET